MTRLFACYLVLLLLRPQEILPQLAGVPILQFVLLACLGLWAVGSDKQLASPPIKLAAALLLFMPLTVGLNGWWGGVGTAFGVIGPVFALFLVATLAARRIESLHTYMWTMLICACVLVYHSKIQLETGVGPITGVHPFKDRPYYVGIFSDPNDLGQFFVISLAFALHLLQVSQRRTGRLLLLAAIAWLCFGAILSNSRGTLIAALAVLAIECWRRFGRTGVAVGVALTVPALYAMTRLKEVNAEEESAYGRIEAWYQGLQMLKNHPLYGIGFGNFTEYNEQTAHNFIILPMAELGLIGFMLWAGILFYAVRMLWWVGFGPHCATEMQTDARVTSEVLAARGLLLTLAGFGVSAFFLSQSFKAMFFLLCGFAAARFYGAATVLPDPPRYTVSRDLLRIAIVSGAAAVAMYFIVKAMI